MRAKGKARNSYYAKAKKVVKTCLKDADFKKDFIEEKDSTDSYLKANACEILLQEKIDRYPRGKPRGTRGASKTLAHAFGV